MDTSQMDGNEWEKYCMLLLRRYFGADQVQEVPARHKGDLGIEAFTQCGRALQCYVPEEPLPISERYEKQRDKLTTDLKKLEKYATELKEMLGSVRISKYLFMVPVFDSREIIKHATSKTDEYRRKKLPHLTDDFHIRVLNAEAFAEQQRDVLKKDYQLVQVVEVTGEQVSQWRLANSGVGETADRKLEKVFREEQKRIKYLEALIGQYLSGKNSLEEMRNKYPDQWEKIENYKSSKEATLILDYPEQQAQAANIRQIAQEIEKEVIEQCSNVDRPLAKKLAWMSLTDWLLRCPLDFEEVA